MINVFQVDYKIKINNQKMYLKINLGPLSISRYVINLEYIGR